MSSPRSRSSLSAAEARRISLAAQGFAKPRPAAAGTRQLNGALARMGTLQIGANGDAAMAQPFEFDKFNVDQFAKLF